MLVKPKGPKLKGFLGAAKATDNLPFQIVCLQRIEHEGVRVYPYTDGLAYLGTCYTYEQSKEITVLRKEGKIFLDTSSHVFKIEGVVTTASKAASLGIPISPKS